MSWHLPRIHSLRQFYGVAKTIEASSGVAKTGGNFKELQKQMRQFQGETIRKKLFFYYHQICSILLWNFVI